MDSGRGPVDPGSWVTNDLVGELMNARKIYLAGPYSQQAFLRQVRHTLQGMGHTVTSRWLDAVAREDRPDDPTWATGYAADCAERDIIDIYDADTFVLYTGKGGSTRGGMYVELGIAIRDGQQLYIIGDRTNVFTYLPEVNSFLMWDTFYMHLAKEPHGPIVNG